MYKGVCPLITRLLKQINVASKLPSNVPSRGNRVLVFMGALYLKLSGWRVEGEFPNEPKFIIAVAPHTSNWDFTWGMGIMFCRRLKVSFMAKSNLFFWPISSFMAWLGGIPVDRTKTNGVVSQMVDKFDNQDSLVLAIAPEGTRKRISPWKTGFLQIAHKADVPLQMVALDYKNKTIILGPSRKISADIDEELKIVLAYFATIPAKYPEKCDTSGLPFREK